MTSPFVPYLRPEEGRHPERPWWRPDSNVLLPNGWRRSDGQIAYDHIRPAFGPEGSEGKITLVEECVETAEAMMARLDAEHPLACPELAVGQVWWFPDGSYEMVVAVHRGKPAALAFTYQGRFDRAIPLSVAPMVATPPPGAVLVYAHNGDRWAPADWKPEKETP